MAQLVGGTPQQKSWFFTITAIGAKLGLRFLDNDRPEQQTFQNLLESTAFKTEVTDQAQLDSSSSTLSAKAGLVVLATAVQAKANTANSPGQQSLVTTPDQLPSVAGTAQAITIETVTFNDLPITVTVDSTVSSRNNFLLTLNTTFVTFLTTLFTNVYTAINTVAANLASLVTSYNAFVTATNTSISTLNSEVASLLGTNLPIGSQLGIFNTNTSITIGTAVWLNMNGQAVSRTTYSTLFAAIGTTYGVGDGSTTFNLPNYNGAVMRGGSAWAVKTSNDSITIGANNLPAHTHDMASGSVAINGGAHTHTLPSQTIGVVTGGYNILEVTGGTNTATSSNTHSHPNSEFSGNTGNNTTSNTAISIIPSNITTPMFVKAL